MVEFNIDIITDAEGNFYAIITGKRSDIVITSKWMWNIDKRKTILETIKEFMNRLDIKQDLKEPFEKKIKDKFKIDLEVNVNKTKTISAEYNPKDDTIIIKYLLSTKPRKKEKKERILGESYL
ncbi:MAG: hypothetical protein ACP5IB_06660 [Thermoplasmata archaeon]